MYYRDINSDVGSSNNACVTLSRISHHEMPTRSPRNCPEMQGAKQGDTTMVHGNSTA